jgi:flavin-dependent dehydrogenase
MRQPSAAVETFDAIVVGGGPAGSVCATKLAERGRRVLVLEREKFPRYHLGESLLPGSMPVLESIGVMPELEQRFLRKYGARFHHHETSKKERYSFANAFDTRFGHAFQVPRDEFDEVLLRNAARRGAEVREGWKVERASFEPSRAPVVHAVDPSGAARAFEARIVVDATGRDALIAGSLRDKARIERLDRSAIYTQYRGVRRAEGEQEGDIDIVIFPSGWFWFIPFKDGRTSVGAVVPNAWVKESQASGAGTPDAMLARALGESAAARELLEGAEPVWTNARATADFSYRVGRRFGDGWLVVGDAGGFIDPLFSSGAHLAICGAAQAADAVDAALEAGDPSAARFVEWAAGAKLAEATFTDAVHAFYGGGLLRYLFAEKKHTFLRRSITSLLAGDVYSPSARWIVDVRARLADMATAGWKPDAVVGTG